MMIGMEMHAAPRAAIHGETSINAITFNLLCSVSARSTFSQEAFQERVRLIHANS